ncbi:MAG: chromosome segregation protein SMC [Firmicutes bacterium]|nr:chromosome segregation protein SMC [Bacillota bacterium]
MYFKRLELNGFKSFADPVTIEFTEGMTCIVGPNGSGKSNISDAIRWVLGEQSPKMLRGGKMEEVIFAGTQNRKPKGLAEVTLVIDNSDHTLPIDYTEVGITRRMYRSGESEYMINRTPCRLRDIRELIMDTGIGVEGYSIIGQGKIADIISNKMDSRREIFEEAAGIVKYRNRKAETERKLDSASQNLARVNDIASEIEGRIDGLKRDSEKAQEYLQIREKYKDVEINIVLKNIDAADSKTGAVRTEMEELDRILAEDRSRRESLENELRAMRASNAETESALEELRRQIGRVTEEIHFIESREGLNNERYAALERDRVRLEGERDAAMEKIERETANLQEMQQTKAAVSGEEAAARRKAEEASAAAEGVWKQLTAKEQELEAAKASILELTTAISAAAAEVSSMENLKQTLQRRLQRLQEDGEDAESEGLASRLEQTEDDLQEAKDSKARLQKDLAEAMEQRAAMEKEQAASAAAIEAIRVRAGELAARHKLLEELERSYEGYNGAVRFMMQEGLSGIVGTVGELLSVPKGWEVAVETALGGNVQNIICDSDSSAKKAIERLKAKKAGRLTFLPADSIKAGKPADLSAIQGLDGFLGLASERVTCKGGYENIVDYLLGKVVVCRDLDSALKLSKKGGSLRYVTLEGEHINPAGAITGGSFKNNTANIISRKAEKEDLEKQIRKTAGELQEAEEARDECRRKLSGCLQDVQEIQAGIAGADRTVAVLEKEVQQLKVQRQDARDAAGRRLAEQADLEKEIAEADRNIGEIRSRSANQEASRSETQETADRLAEETEAVRASYEEAQAANTAARMEENAAAVKLRGAEDLEERVRASLAELQAEQRSKEQSLSDIAVQKGEIEAFAAEAKAGLKDKQDSREALEANEAELSARRKEAQTKADELEEERIRADSVLYEHQVSKHDAEVRLARFDAQTESLKEKLWEEFEMSYAQAKDFADPDFVMSRGMKESREYKERLRELGDVNVGAIEEYKAVSERYAFLTAQRDDLNQAIEELNSVIRDIDATIKARFKESFDAVVENFEATFTELFKGGHARLTLDDPNNPLESAIEIEAQPPGKKLQNMNLLSGGEKTMTAIALMFAVLKAKPTPFCILDEVEAALDETNIDSFARYLRQFTETQFALITHQKATMEYADVLYGVTMPEQGITRVLSLKLGDRFDID